MKNNIEVGMKVKYFVGYHAAEDGIAEAIVDAMTDNLVTFHVFTENDDWYETTTIEEYEYNKRWLKTA